MTLKFKPERLAIIKRLKDLTISEIENKMMEIGGRKNRISIDRWTKDGWKHPEGWCWYSDFSHGLQRNDKYHGKSITHPNGALC